MKRLFIIVVFYFLISSALADESKNSSWDYYVQNNNGADIYSAAVYRENESLTVSCAVSSPSEVLLTVSFYSKNSFTIDGKLEIVDIQVDNSVFRQKWLANHPQLVYVYQDDVLENLITYFKEESEVHIRPGAYNSFIKFNTVGGEKEIRKVMDQC